MSLIDNTSLSKTIDNINDAFFFNKEIKEKDDIIDWLIARYDKEFSYEKLLSPFEKDLAEPLQVFTGEKIKSNASIRHILGEEAGRLLFVLIENERLKEKINRKINYHMFKRLIQSENKYNNRGVYCCGFCTVALWRNLSVGAFYEQQERLFAAVTSLKEYRDNKGTWGKYPFYYTLLALTEINNEPAKEEINYAKPRFENLLKRNLSKRDIYSQRRAKILQNALELIT